MGEVPAGRLPYSKNPSMFPGVNITRTRDSRFEQFLKQCGTPARHEGRLAFGRSSHLAADVNVISPSITRRNSSSFACVCSGGPPPGGSIASNAKWVLLVWAAVATIL